MGSSEGRTRRRFLQALTVAGVGGIAGCRSNTGDRVTPGGTEEFSTTIGEAANDALSPSPLTQNWRFRHRDAANTGVSPATGPREDVVRGWLFEASVPADASPPDDCYPVIDDGRVFVSTYEGDALVRLDPTTGAIDWRYDAVSSGGVPAVVGPADDRIVVTPGADGLHGVDAASGQQRWHYGNGSFDHDGNVVAADGAVYAFGRNDTIHAVEVDTGRQRFTVQGVHVGAAADGTLVLGDRPLRAVSTTDGSPLWNVSGVVPYGSVAIRDGTVYVGELGSVEAYSLADGAHEWTYSGKTEDYRTPAVTGDRVIVGSMRTEVAGGNLYALDRSDGTEQWSVAYGSRGLTQTAVANGVVYTMADDVVDARRVSDGGSVWTYREQYGWFETAAVSGNLLLVGTSDGTVRAFCEGESAGRLTDAPTSTPPSVTPPE